jgi:hypothetical protein
MIHLLTASTLYQVASLAAMVDAGTLRTDGGERILVLANGSQQPELTARIQDSAGFERLARRFDRVVDLAELLWPRRPQQFSPRNEELYLWERLLRSHWGLGTEPVALVVDTIQVNPAIALSRIFHDAPLTVHSDGLMAYGPTRNRVPTPLRQRLDAVAYFDIVPGLRPVLLNEVGPELVPAPRQALADVFRELAAAAVPSEDLAAAQASGRPCALVLGQYLADLRVLAEDEEVELHRGMLAAARERGAELVLFKPHPSASNGSTNALFGVAAGLGIELTVVRDNVSAETVALWVEPLVVVSCFSTALVTLKYLFGTDCVAVGTELLLERLQPYQNSNRIPVTLIDALLVRGMPAPSEAGPRADRLQDLVDSVAYCMQSGRLPDLRSTAESFLQDHGDRFPRYFKRRRLTALGLPGQATAASWRRQAGRVRRRARRVLGGRLDPLRRAWKARTRG